MTDQFLKNLNNYLEKQIPLLLSPYIEENTLLQQQNKELQLEIEILKEQLQALLEKSEPIMDKPAFTKEESPKDKIEWFYTYLNALESNNEQVLAIYTPNFVKQANSMNQINKTSFPNFLKKLVDLLLQTKNIKTIETILTLFLKASGSKKNSILLHLKNNSLLKNKLVKNEQLCNLKLQLFNYFKLSTTSKDYIAYLLKNHAVQIENSITNEQFSQLFWYAFIFNEEKLFFQVYSHKQQWLRENPLTTIYFKASDKKLTSAQLQQYNNILKKAKILTSDELMKIYKKLDIHKKTDSKTTETQPIVKLTKYFSKNNLYVIKDAAVSRFKKEFILKPGTISLKLYEGNSSLNGKTVKMEVLLNSKRTAAYITEKDFNQYKKKFSPLKLQASKYYYDFVWPSTTISSTTNSKSVQEALPLNQESKLAKLGYHYTLHQNVRWDILKKAVKQFGLQSVAYTLASITKRLKGRSPDSKAIVVWEFDLQRLKQTFYKRNFNWPVV